MAEEGGAGASRTFAERLDQLFATSHPAGRPEVGYQDVVDAIVEQGGPTVTSSYLYMLRTGRRENPSIPLMQALARYFEVPVAFFVDDDAAAAISDQLELLAALRDADVHRLAMRSRGLSPESREALAAIIERLRSAEGLNE